MDYEFIHFIDLNDFYICGNLANSGKISSPSLDHLILSNSFHPIYTISIDELWSNTKSFNTFSSPRLSNFLMSRSARQGMTLGVGMDNTRLYTKEEIDVIHKYANIEFEFEKVRRLVNPQLPSRFISLFLAENNDDGKVMLKNMFSFKKDFIIAPMKINFLMRFHKADSQWFDEYFHTKDEKAIYNYWQGHDYNSIPLYEYLVDGQLELKDKIDQEKIVAENAERHKN